MVRISLTLVLSVACLAACSAPELEEETIAKPTAAQTVRESVEAIRAEAETSYNPQLDPMMEERCAEVTEVEMDRVEEQMTKLASETVILRPDEMLALSCSRYRKSVSGEIESY